MKKLKLYFDTSIFNFAFADDAPDKKVITLKLIEEVRKSIYEVYISTVVLREILEAQQEKAKKLMKLINDLQPFELQFDNEGHDLASEYIKRSGLEKLDSDISGKAALN